MEIDVLRWCNTFFNHGRSFVAFNAKMIFALLLFEYDVDVSGDQLHDLFGFGGLYRIILVGVVAKIQGKCVWRRTPSPYRCQWPCFQNFFGAFIQTEYRIFCDAQQTRHQLIFAIHFLFHQEKCDAICGQFASSFCVRDFRIDFGYADVPTVLGENFLLNVFDAGI